MTKATRQIGLAESTIAAVVALLGAALLFGAFVGDGGRYLDHWWLGGYVRFPGAFGFDGSLDYLNFYSGARPGAVLYWLGTYDIFGLHDDFHRVGGIALGAGLAATTYVLMRELRLSRLDSALVAAFTLALPTADSIHFWMTPSVGQLCVALWGAGLVAALRAFDSDWVGARRYHALSLVLFAASLLFAETMLPAIGLSVLVYRSRSEWAPALRRWAADLVLVGLAIVHYAVSTPVRLTDDREAVGAFEHARTIGSQIVRLITSTLVPAASSPLPVLAVLAVIGAAVGVRARGSGPASAAQRRWLAIAGGALLFTLASYAIYVPADASYMPLAMGVGNRINLGALVPLSVFAYAVLRLTGEIVPGRAGLIAAPLLAVAVLAPAIHREHADRELWLAAAKQQRAILGAIHAAAPAPPHGASLLLLDAPGVVTRFTRIGHRDVNQSVPVFSTWWELGMAVRLSYRRPDLSAYPLWSDQPAQLLCGAHEVYQLGLDGVRHAIPYGLAFLVSASRRTSLRLAGQRQCTEITGRGQTGHFDLPV